MNVLQEVQSSIGYLLFPELCLACQHVLGRGEKMVCLSCESRLPRTDYQHNEHSPFMERFWGRLPVTAGSSLLFYEKGNRVQQLIFQLKYHGRRDLGVLLGRWYGRTIRSSPWIQTLDCIVPVPLHPKKKAIRGYNQSAAFGQGIAEVLGVPLRENWLIRTEHTETQTKKNVFERVENMQEVFAIAKGSTSANEHVLLVDDVLTTGATLEACAQVLIQAAGAKVQLGTIAIAR